MRVMELAGDWGLDHIRLGNRPDPAPGPGEVLVRLAAASVNYRDAVVLRRGYGRLSGTLPLIVLSDGAGRVEALGAGVSRFAPGDLVCPIIMPGWHAGPLRQQHREALLGGPRDGVARELMVVAADDLVRAPSYMTPVEAATLPCAAVTAWSAIVGAGVKPGDVVVTQGTGGVSLFALQFARMLGAETIIMSGSPEKLARAKAMGASHGIDYRAQPEWSREVRRLAPEGADLVIEVGGAGTLAQSLRAVRAGGTVALIGVLAGATAELDLGRIVTQGVRLLGVTLGSRASFEEMVRALELHRARPAIDDHLWRFEEAREAISAIESGRHFGKICLSF
ncbi:MAG TPA: NAD(P)-dependent alcohol dehydrogenase [Stellaceae bacterium]|nr:NAD(P)-dependent alcohol dehydrogenase [Stellaceae bacterium]